MTVHLACTRYSIPLFVKCLKSLPNLHTLEIGCEENFATTPLKDALEDINLPQIKTLILPPSAHPLIRHSPDVEDVVCVVRHQTASPDGFLGSLASNRNSKVKRLAIPLILWGNPSSK